ncbi:hypothetical protein [Nocardiopsis dassonvillei]|uniref:hypothetical protein n=1 Tax=Nocardiopsis dassonvillei TaxID=2014 RepID=UPI0022844283|nr:hypothetical protein [Nocardiopsis dassonvillei]
MRFRYREYMGGPDPLAEPGPPPEEAVAAARELLVLVSSALEAAGSATDPGDLGAGSATGEGLGAGSEGGPGVLAEEDRRRLSALEDVLSRYADGDRAALGSADAATLGRLPGLLGGEAGRILARLGGGRPGPSPGGPVS